MGAFSAAKYITIKNQGQESAHTCAQLEMVGRVHKLLVHNWKWSKSWEESILMKEGFPSLPIIVQLCLHKLGNCNLMCIVHSPFSPYHQRSTYKTMTIHHKVGFNYKMELVHDNNYGALNLTTNKWNGLVRVFTLHNFSFNPLCFFVEQITSFPNRN